MAHRQYRISHIFFFFFFGQRHDEDSECGLADPWSGQSDRQSTWAAGVCRHNRCCVRDSAVTPAVRAHTDFWWSTLMHKHEHTTSRWGSHRGEGADRRTGPRCVSAAVGVWVCVVLVASQLPCVVDRGVTHRRRPRVGTSVWTMCCFSAWLSLMLQL